MEKSKEKFPCPKCVYTPEFVFKIWAYERDAALRHLRRKNRGKVAGKCWLCLQRFVFKLWAMSPWIMKEFGDKDLIVMRYVLSSYASLNLKRVLIQCWRWNVEIHRRNCLGYNKHFKSQAYRKFIRDEYWCKRTLAVHKLLYAELEKHGQAVNEDCLARVRETIIDPMVLLMEQQTAKTVKSLEDYEEQIRVTAVRVENLELENKRLEEENERLKAQLSDV